MGASMGERGAGYCPAASSRARRASAESLMRSAPRTPCAPGSCDAPITLSRWRALRESPPAAALPPPQPRALKVRTTVTTRAAAMAGISPGRARGGKVMAGVMGRMQIRGT